MFNMHNKVNFFSYGIFADQQYTYSKLNYWIRLELKKKYPSMSKLDFDILYHQYCSEIYKVITSKPYNLYGYKIKQKGHLKFMYPSNNPADMVQGILYENMPAFIISYLDYIESEGEMYTRVTKTIDGKEIFFYIEK